MTPPTPAPGPGRPSRAELEERVRVAIWHRGESLWLDESPLTSLPAVKALASDPKYRGKWCGAGKALQELIYEGLACGAVDLDPYPARLAAELTKPEGRLIDAAKALGFTAPHVCRDFRPTVVRRVLFHLEGGDSS